MEYVAGGSLERLVRSHDGPVPLDVAVTVMEQIAEGLAVAHDQDPPILHRDLTPANVLVGYDGSGLRVRISDFGLATRADAFTLAASAQGTIAHMAPEVFDGGGWTRAGDVWAIGCLGYLLLTDRLPYDEDRPFASLSPARFRRRLLPPSAYQGEVPAALDALVVAALAVDPRDRPPDARALAAAVRALPLPPDPGAPAGTDERADERARALLGRAKELARIPGGLDRAADVLEEAVSLSPALRVAEAERLTRWRRGVIA
jgi:serine/threonine-protein kinase